MDIEQVIAEILSIRDFWLWPRHGDNGRAFEVREAVDVAVEALRAQQEAEKSEALTLEELRQMDGEPVYIVPLKWYGKKEWTIVERNLCRCLSPVNNYYFEEYGNLWLAYRRPPVKEEG